MKMGTSHLSFRHLVLCLIAVTLASVGCSSKKNDQAGLSLSVPQYQSLSKGVNAQSGVGELTHVFISITGPNIGVPISFEWSQCKECTNKLSAPSSFKLGVPTGDSRLIQVLVVYEDDSSGATGIYYGDVTQNLVSGDNSVGVNVASILQTNNLIEGRIAGRYIDKTELVNVSGVTQPVAYGPTGEVLIKYKPLNKPAMTIDRSSIVNGWMNFFALKDINFNYEMPDGRILFQNVNLDSFKPNTTGAVPGKYAHVWMPQHYRQYDAGQTPEKENEKIHILGWFGNANLSSFEVCMPSSASTTTLPPLYSRDSNAVKGGNLNLAYKTSLVQPTAGSTDVNVYNATQKTTGNCDLLEIYETVHFVGKESLINGNDSIGGVRGTMSLFLEGSNYIFHNITGSPSQSIRFELLPGVPLVTTSFEHWQIDPTQLQNKKFETVPCRAIRNGLIPGFSKVNSVSTTLGVRTVNFLWQTADSTKLNVFCPVFNNFTLDTGFIVRPKFSANSVNMDVRVTRSGLEYTAEFFNDHSTQSAFLTSNICHKIELRFFKNGTQVDTSSLSLTLSNFEGTSYTDNTCNTGGSTITSSTPVTLNYVSGSQAHVLYFKPNVTTPSSKTSSLNITQINGDNLTYSNWNFRYDFPRALSDFDKALNVAFSNNTSACYKTRVTFGYHTRPDKTLRFDSTESVNTITPTTSVLSSASCSLISSISLSAIESFSYFRPSNQSSYTFLNPGVTISSLPFNLTEATSSPDTPSKLHIMYRADMSSKICKAFQVRTLDSTGVVCSTSSITSNIESKVSGTSQSNYSSLQDCEGGGTSPTTTSSGDSNYSTKYFFVKVPAGTTSLEMNASGATFGLQDQPFDGNSKTVTF